MFLSTDVHIKELHTGNSQEVYNKQSQNKSFFYPHEIKQTKDARGI